MKLARFLTRPYILAFKITASKEIRQEDMMKKIRRILALGLVMCLALSTAVFGEEVKDSLTSEEQEEFYRNWQDPDQEVKDSLIPEEGSVLEEDAYRQDKMIYVPEGYVGYDVQLDVPVYFQKMEILKAQLVLK